MKRSTIFLLCITVIWSYYKTAINGEEQNGKLGCLLCKTDKTLFCRSQSINSLVDIVSNHSAYSSSIKRLVADGNKIKLTEEDIKALDKLTSLNFLDLRDNKIKNLALNNHTAGIENPNLTEIDLDGNKIERISSHFVSKFPNLEILRLGGNKITHISEDLLKGNKRLKAFDVSNNGIVTIPPGLFEVENKKLALEALLVDGTNLKDIDTDMLIKKLPNLRGLNVRKNKEMIWPLDPRLFYEHETLQFLFTSGYADCCNIRRMKKSPLRKKTNLTKDWYCAFRDSNWKEACAIRIRSGKEADPDSHMGRVEYNFNETENWQRLTSDNWTMNEAHVVCRETGYEKALEYINATNYPVILNSLVNTIFFPSKKDEETPKLWIGKCNGTEYSILRCNGASINTADRTDGVGVRCKHPDEKMEKLCTNDGNTYECPGNKNVTINNLPWQEENDTGIQRIVIRNQKIRWIHAPSLTFFKNLIELDLSGNGLGWVGNDIFRIETLEKLDLHQNNLGYITGIVKKNNKEMKRNANWFGGLTNLKNLDMSANHMEYFPSNVFQPLKSIQNLSLRSNVFQNFHDDFFSHLGTLKKLDISDMEGKLIIENWVEHFKRLTNLNYLIASRFTDCCFFHAARPNGECDAPSDAIASCDRMIKYSALRYLMWFLVVLTIGGNIFALLMRLVKDDNNRVQNILICSLSFSDMLMGVYLAGIINQEIATRGEYYKHDISWRTGTSCKVFGVISVLSSEVSVFTLVFIAYDRFLHIVHAMEFRKIGYRTAVCLLAVTWLGCSAIAIIPAMVDSYFYNDARREGFYGTNSICLPLQLPGESTVAWEYCLAVFGVLNFIGAVYLIVAYCQMFYSSYTSAKNSKNNARLGVHTTMAKRFAAVVFTDVCCWVPIAMLLMLSLTRAITDAGNELYLWFSICVIPINSAINPILYTLSTPLFWEKVKETIKKMLFCISKGDASAVDDKPELIENLNREKTA